MDNPQAAGGRVFLKSNGDGTYTQTGSFSVGVTSTLQGITMGDFNGDGKVDVVVTGSGLGGNRARFYAGGGDGTFTGPTTSNFTVAPSSGLISDDFNGDGAIDAFSSNGVPTPRLYLGITTSTNNSARLYLMDQQGARAALTSLSEIQDNVSKEQGKIGSLLSRMEHAVSNLDSVRTNYAAANSRITDVDVAEETAKLISEQVLRDSSAAVLAQANQSASLVIDLLK